MSSENIFLSIVVAARNDDYGGDFLKRLQNFISWNTSLLEQNKIGTEIIIVNWNPVAENTGLEQALKFPENRTFVHYRIIHVPAEIHQNFVDESVRKTVPLFEYLAKNTGIRRAKGEFVLCMNPDILLAPEIFTDFRNYLSEKFYYRADRLDYSSETNTIESIHQSGFKLFLKGFIIPLENFTLEKFKILQKKYLQIALWRKYSIKTKFFSDHTFKWNYYSHNAEYYFHCNVSGDFMLMHRNKWHELKGYKETSYLSLHTDALMVIQAAMSGLKEKIFSVPVYHQAHDRRYDAVMENPVYRETYLTFQKEAQQMLSKKKPFIYNTDLWGLAKFELPESIIR